MRSRYSAFARADVKYLRATQLKPLDDSDEGTQTWARSVGWVGLSIVSKEQGDAGDDTGFVEFIARYVDKTGVTALHERSHFVRREGRWCYDRGEPQATLEKVERNAPCPCGSGRKYKQCHS